MNPLLILSNMFLQFSVVSGLIFTSSPFSSLRRRRNSRHLRRRRRLSHFWSVSGVETCTPFLKLLMTQASPVFGLRFLRLASAPEQTRTRLRSKQRP